MSKQTRNVFVSSKTKCENAPQRRQGLGSTICRYLPLIDCSCCYLSLFGANRSAICRYLPLIVPLFAAIYCYLSLIVINCHCLPLTMSRISSPKGLSKVVRASPMQLPHCLLHADRIQTLMLSAPFCCALSRFSGWP